MNTSLKITNLTNNFKCLKLLFKVMNGGKDAALVAVDNIDYQAHLCG